MIPSDNDQSEDHFQLQRKLSRRTFGFVVVVAIGLFVLDQKEMARGLLLGTLFSVINFVLLAYTLPQLLGHRRKKATLFAFSSIFLRFSLLAVPLVVALKVESFDFWAVVGGLFSVPLAVMVDQYIGHRKMIRSA